MEKQIVLFSFLDFHSDDYFNAFFGIFIVKHTQHKIYHFKVHNSVTLNTFTVLCNHPHSLVPELLHHPRWKLHAH